MLDNRIRIKKETIEILKRKGFNFVSTQELSMTVHSIIDEYLNSLPCLDVPKNKSLTIESLKRTNSRNCIKIKFFNNIIPDELNSFAKQQSNNTKIQTLNTLVNKGIKLCKNLYEYLCKICFGRKWDSEMEKLKVNNYEMWTRKRNMIGICINILSNVCHPQSINFGLNLGVILVSSGTSSRDIGVLSKIGITSCYTTIQKYLSLYIENRVSKSIKEVEEQTKLMLLYSDNLEFYTGVKYELGEKQNKLIHTITSIYRTIPNIDNLDVVSINEGILEYSNDFIHMLLPKAENLYNKSIKEALINIHTYFEKSNIKKGTTNTNYLKFECFPSFLGNGGSNKDKTLYYENFPNTSLIAHGDQVFASFVHRAHCHRKLMNILPIAGDWHFHNLDLQSLLKHGWVLFKDLVNKINTKVKKESKHYYSNYAFIQVFTKGMLVWMIKSFLKSINIEIDLFIKFGWTNYFSKEFKKFYSNIRSTSKTIDTLCHLMELGITNLKIKNCIRNNEANDLRMLWILRLRLLALNNHRNYFQLAAFQMKQNNYLEKAFPNILKILDENRCLSISGKRYVASDEFVENNHAEIKNGRLVLDEESISFSIQKRIYVQQLMRQNIENSGFNSDWDLTEDVETFSCYLGSVLGESINDIPYNIKGNKLKSVFSSKIIEISPKNDPQLKYEGVTYDYIVERLINVYTFLPADPTLYSEEEEISLEVDEGFAVDYNEETDEPVISEQFVSVNRSCIEGRSLGHLIENISDINLQKRTTYKGLGKEVTQHSNYSMDVEYMSDEEYVDEEDYNNDDFILDSD